MKILISISYYYPNISGVTIHAQHLAKSWAKRGHDVAVLTSRHKKELKSRETIGGVKVRRVWTPIIFGRGPIMPTFPFEAFTAVRNADIVNCHIPQFEGVIVALIAKLLGKKIILTHHCDLSQWPGLINKIAVKMTYFSLLITGHLADKIIVYTKDYADNSKYLQRFEDKLIYTLPPVEVKKVAKGNKLKTKYENVEYKVGFAGRISREKGIPVLLNALPLIKDKLGDSLKIFLAGPSKDVIGTTYGELEEAIEKHKNDLVFLGSLNQKQMASFYNMIDLLVLPSVEPLESFGLVQVEAMMFGCPVVASNLPGVRIPIKLSGMGRTASTGDSKDLAKRIVEVLKNKDKFTKSKKEIKGKFDPRKTFDLYEKLFKDLSQK